MVNGVPYRVYSQECIYYAATGVSPHTATVRASVAVPANTYFHVDNVYISIRRVTAASTAGDIRARFQVLVGGSETAIIAQARLLDNTVNAFTHAQVSPDIYFLPGDELQLVTVDPSTGGTVDYHLYVVVKYVK